LRYALEGSDRRERAEVGGAAPIASQKRLGAGVAIERAADDGRGSGASAIESVGASAASGAFTAPASAFAASTASGDVAETERNAAAFSRCPAAGCADGQASHPPAFTGAATASHRRTAP
jgi:hypothetical protein